MLFRRFFTLPLFCVLLPGTVSGSSLDLFVTATVDSARVSINGTERGFTPLKVSGLAPGTVAVLVEKPGYRPVTDNVAVKTGAPNGFEAVMVRATGRLIISSVPPGAQIRLKGKPAGQTPMTIDNMAAGTCPVHLLQEPFAPCDTQVMVDADTTVTFHHVFRNKGSLFIASEPLGASVVIDGESCGKTPCTVKNIPPGSRTVRLEKNGYLPLQQAVDARPETTVSVTLALKKDIPAAVPGISVVTRPVGARIMHNGKQLGTTPLNGTLLVPAGDQSITIRKKGFEPYRTVVNRDDAARNSIETGLVPKTPAKALVRSLVPGWGQFYSGKGEKALVFSCVEGLCLAGSVLLFYRFSDQAGTWQDYDNAYQDAGTQAEMDRFESLRNDTYRDLESTALFLNICSATAAAVWLANLADAYFLFPDNKPEMKFNLSDKNTGISINIRL